MTQLERLRKEAKRLAEKIEKLEKRERQQKFLQRLPDPLPSVSSANHVIQFDGGTTSNVPSRGFGYGYGSYQIDGGVIGKCQFGIGHSCNSAEILTLFEALKALRLLVPECDKKTVRVCGDSKIALKWVSCQKQPKESTTIMFRQAIEMLRGEVKNFKKIYTEWRPREHSVKLFGH